MLSIFFLPEMFTIDVKSVEGIDDYAFALRVMVFNQ
jgi:hypothetical protein